MKKRLIIYSIIIILLFSFTGYRFIDIENNNTTLEKRLKSSGFWTENDFNYIHIDNNWSAAEAVYDWVQWDSTFSNYVIENISLNCNGNPFGILIENSMTWDFEIRNCTIFNATSNGIRIDNTWWGIIDDCSLVNNHYGINIEDSMAIVIQNCNIINNSVYGVFMVFSDFNTVRWSNITSNNVGVMAVFSDSINILENSITKNNNKGIEFARCDDCRIEGNTLLYNTGISGGGIYWDGGSNNAITKNQISGNREGIVVTESSGSTGTSFLGIVNNNVTYNTRAGISIIDYSVSYKVNIRNNNISGNNRRGIQVAWAINTTIDNNYIDNNGDNGITIVVDHNTTISNNIISNNGGHGIYHGDEVTPRQNLVVHNNTVSRNSDWNIYIASFDDHATYPGSFTYNTIIGFGVLDYRTSVYNTNSWNYNYFSYYSGEDANDDGIGDTAQDIWNPTITIQDQNPRWWDSPLINIISPSTNDYVNATGPEISYDISRGVVDTVWYNLHDGITQTQNYTYSSSIDQSAWDLVNDGDIWISLYINDSKGLEDSDVVKVIKDTKDIVAPKITIISPTLNQFFPLKAPEFTIEVDEVNLDTLWYTINGGLTNIIFTSNQTIDQTEWSAQSDGTITITFYANDTFGRVNSSSISIIKDSTLPTINLLNPIGGETFGEVAPNFTAIIYDANLDDMWYTIDGGMRNITFTGNGTLDQSEWSAHSDGLVTLIFYAKDFAGNEFSHQVGINKDTSVPIITIISPLLDEYLSSSPVYNIMITEPDLDSYWYTLDGGTTNITLLALSGTLGAEWLAALDGPITIRFYANDSYSNENFAEITINKDTITPKINIISPEDDQQYQEYPPEYLIEIDEINLISYWYTIDDGVNNYTITELVGTINSGTWSAAPSGTITIRFYARDLAGNIGTSFVIIVKTSSPSQPQPSIPGYDLYLIIVIISFISIILIRRQFKSYFTI